MDHVYKVLSLRSTLPSLRFIQKPVFSKKYDQKRYELRRAWAVVIRLCSRNPKQIPQCPVSPFQIFTRSKHVFREQCSKSRQSSAFSRSSCVETKTSLSSMMGKGRSDLNEDDIDSSVVWETRR
jgi:hypothetical protein